MEEGLQSSSINSQSNGQQVGQSAVKQPQVPGANSQATTGSTVKSYIWRLLGFSDKTLWDVLKLGIIPFALLLLGTSVNNDFLRTQAQLADSQRQIELRIADNQRLESVLQNYLDRMTDLVANSNFHNSDQAGKDIRNLARARTLTTLRILDGSRKGIVLRYLSYMGFINQNPPPIVNLDGADLSGAELSGFELSGADLAKVDLTNANLKDADLNSAYLAGANLTGANLTNVNLRFAKLYNYNPQSNQPLEVVNLTNANLKGADLTGADLTRAIWSNTTCPNGTKSNTNGLKHC